MRIACRVGFSLFWLAILLCAGLLRAVPQNPDTLLPEQSAAKAHQLLEEMVAALGGPAFLGVRDSVCEGRFTAFGHAGELVGMEDYRDYWKFPEKKRTEHSKKGNIIDIENGDRGWTLDRGGVSELPEERVSESREQTKKSMNNLLRFRLNEEGMVFRYGGSDVVDLKQVDWVEIEDRDRRTFRIAIDRSTHLPVRSVVMTRNPENQERTEEQTYYSAYNRQDGVQTPFQVTRERDGRKVYQVFLKSCKYDTGLAEELFTRASLDSRYSTMDKKFKNTKTSKDKKAIE